MPSRRSDSTCQKRARKVVAEASVHGRRGVRDGGSDRTSTARLHDDDAAANGGPYVVLGDAEERLVDDRKRLELVKVRERLRRIESVASARVGPRLIVGAGVMADETIDPRQLLSGDGAGALRFQPLHLSGKSRKGPHRLLRSL
jgi:hypothetical protein